AGQGMLIPRPVPTRPGREEYEFGGAVTRQVAYERLPRALRAERHLRVAAWLGATAPRGGEAKRRRAQHVAAAMALTGLSPVRQRPVPAVVPRPRTPVVAKAGPAGVAAPGRVPGLVVPARVLWPLASARAP